MSKKIKFYVSTGYVGCAHEETLDLEDFITAEEWENTIQAEKNELLDQWCEEWIWNHIECSANIVEE